MENRTKLIEILEKNEFDIGQAMEICADDMDLYMEVLRTAMEEGGRKLPIIKRSMEIKDYERYHIEVHALKNAMLAIGATDLSKLALEQEKVIKEGNEEKIQKGHEVFVRKYGELLEFLKQLSL